ncbi:mycofactocin-associated electron transfer flavoprotein alpha subunit (plasmid) [Streptomyces yangpuensis]|uniref:Mycofactocin-associated electron transfer flavoprotein alpha subunit n=1 Tax=Streptomyces yangpuensis TaxID=1648182 RepID=A0ABY5Q8C1_9ACTN|nr:mycofactocin-associated electron transfer flavoprotein alpha subunit [Streptomyces yangpuensis]UUY52479.1 mycofactocin-associated electron transfer flavoprotein alpha subunit [Streptomyces yangpuensis]
MTDLTGLPAGAELPGPAESPAAAGLPGTAALPGLPAFPGLLALVVVRESVLPAGADETVAEAGGAVLLVGTGTTGAARELTAARQVWTAEAGTAPAALAAALAPMLTAVHTLVLPASPDGRDLAPRLAAALGRPLLAGAAEILPGGADVLRWGGQALVELSVDGPFVATLEPGLRGAEPAPGGPAEPTAITLPAPPPTADARTLATLEAGAGATSLAQARRILGAGGGLGGPEEVALLGRIADALDASVGATRVVTDAGWLGHDAQIGTTGVLVDPDLYIAFGVSGAPHHTGGLGTPRHVISVNTDPYCPMTAMADLGIVADAGTVLTELAQRLETPDADHS